MKGRKLLVAVATLGVTIGLASCFSGGGKKSGGEISLWVGNESV